MVLPVASGLSYDLAAQSPLQHAQAAKPSDKTLEEREAFQKFAAGTFYQTMMKSLRSTERETKYMNGGRAEKIFRAEFDQHIASSMAAEHGNPFAGPLFDQYNAMRQRDSLLAAAATPAPTLTGGPS